MAQNEVFVTTIKLNSEEAKNKLEELKKKVDELKAKRKEALDAKDSKAFEGLTKDLKKAENELRVFRTETMSINETLDNLGSANINQLEKAIRSLNRQIKNTTDPDELRQLGAQLQLCKNRIAEIGQQHRVATTAADKYNKELKEAEREALAVSNNTELINRTLDKLKTSSVRELEYSMKAINEEMRGVERGTLRWKELTEQMKKCKTELAQIKAETRESESRWSQFTGFLNRNWGAITQIIATYSGTAYTVKKCVEAYAEMDETMTNVRKYTGQTADEVERMNEDFKKMDTRTSREELNELAGAAGRLGIQGTEEIEEFVDAADKINVALGDDLGDKAVDQIGKLSIMFGEDDRRGLRGKMLATGSAVNELAQNSSAAAGYLVDFTARTAGVGKQAGLAQTQIMGFASVLDQNMQQDETSATAFQNLLTKMFQEPAKFAELAGQNVKDFSELLRTDANEAVLQFLQAMHDKGGFAELAPMFEQMSMDGSRATGVLSVMADKLDDIRTAQALAAEAYADGTSVINEFNVQNESVQAQLDKARKKFNDLAVDLGQKLMPVARIAISTSSMAVKALYSIITFCEKHSLVLIALAATITALNAKRLAGIAIAKLEVLWNTRIASSIKAIGTAIKANPWGLAITALTAFVSLLADAARRSQKNREELTALGRAHEQAAEKYEDEAAKIEALNRIVHNNNVSYETRKEKLAELKEIVPDYLADLDREKGLVNDNTDALSTYLEQLEKKIKLQAAQDELEAAYKKRRQLGKQKDEGEQNLQDANNSLAAARFSASQKANSLGTKGMQSMSKGLDIGTKQAQGRVSEATKKLQEVNEQIAKNNADIEALEDEIKKSSANVTKTEPGGRNDGGDGNDGGSSTTNDPYTDEQNRLEESYKKKKNLLKQQYSEFLLSESEYHDQSFAAESEYLAGMFALQGKYGKSQTDTQSRILDLVINETKYKYEQSNVQMQSELADIDSSYNADKIALSQMYMAGELQTEQEYKDKLLEAEEDYQRQRLAIIQRYGGDASKAEEDINKIEFDKFKKKKAESKNELEQQYQSSNSAEEMNRINQQMYDMDLINFETYQRRKTEIANQEAEARKAAEQLAYQTIMQMLSGASAYAQACSDEEVAKVTADYDRQIAAAGNNTKKKEQLEKEKDEKIRQIKTKANKRAMVIEVAQATASTAMAAINAYSSAAQVPLIGYILAPIAAAAATAAGLLQIATIKKQHQAEEAGYYSGGFTGGTDYRRRAGIVHEGEFVANHQAVNNASILPALQLIDMAQRNNTVGSLTAEDVSRSVGGGASTAVVAPIVNVTTDNEELRTTIASLNEVVGVLNTQLMAGIRADVSIDGPKGVAKQLDRYNKLMGNK